MRLEAIASLVPDRRIDVADVIRGADGTADDIRIFTSLFGMQQVAAADPDIGAAGYLEGLLDQMPAPQTDAQKMLLIHAHSLPLASTRLPEAARLQRHPALTGLTAIWDMDQFNCAGMFHAMQAADMLLTSHAVDEVLVFAGDCLADWPLAARYVPSCTVLGDGYALLRLTARTGGVQIGPVATRHFPGYEGGIDGGAEQMDRYNRAHLAIIAESLRLAGHASGQGTIFPHNINGLAWRIHCRQSGDSLDAVRTDLVRETGHCCNADPFIMLDRALDQGPVAGTLLSVGMAGFAGSAPVHGHFAPTLH